VSFYFDTFLLTQINFLFSRRKPETTSLKLIFFNFLSSNTPVIKTLWLKPIKGCYINPMLKHWVNEILCGIGFSQSVLLKCSGKN